MALEQSRLTLPSAVCNRWLCLEDLDPLLPCILTSACAVIGAVLDPPSRACRPRGAAETRGDVERLRLLVEPHPTTSGYWLDLYLYGMQRVRSSNLRSSTSFPGENPTSSLPRQPSRSPDRHLTVVLGGMSEHRAP